MMTFDLFEEYILMKQLHYIDKVFQDSNIRHNKSFLGIGDPISAAKENANHYYNLHIDMYKKIIEDEYKSQFIQAEGDDTVISALINKAFDNIKKLVVI